MRRESSVVLFGDCVHHKADPDELRQRASAQLAVPSLVDDFEIPRRRRLLKRATLRAISP
jgi:hypothetical protein